MTINSDEKLPMPEWMDDLLTAVFVLCLLYAIGFFISTAVLSVMPDQPPATTSPLRSRPSIPHLPGF